MTSKYLFICLAAFAAALLMLGCNHYDDPTEEQTAPISTNISAISMFEMEVIYSGIPWGYMHAERI